MTSQPAGHRRKPPSTPAQSTGPVEYRSDSWLKTAAFLIYILAALTAFGGAIVAIKLSGHVVTSCTGTDLPCNERHPFRAAAWGVFAGGLVETALLLVLARVATVTDQNRDAIAVLRKAIGA